MYYTHSLFRLKQLHNNCIFLLVFFLICFDGIVSVRYLISQQQQQQQKLQLQQLNEICIIIIIINTL